MRYASVCDGIGAAHVAWQHLGWECAWTAEIDPFAAAVVEKHWGYKNLGDITQLTEKEVDECGTVDLLAGGTPCQSFSVGGQRGGLGDPRGNLALRFVQLCNYSRPRWVVWENVPGVLTVNGGRDFACFVQALGDCGYSVVWRVLDSQHFGVPQRRRRIFACGYLGDWRYPAAVLLERSSRGGNPRPVRAAWPQVAGTIAGCANGGGANGPRRTADDADTLVVGFNWQNGGGYGAANDGLAITPNGTGPLSRSQVPAVAYTKAKRAQSRTDDESWVQGAVTPTLNAFDCGDTRATTVVTRQHTVRRLTPLECARLQGFPDGYLDIDYRGKPAADSPKYKAIGNSMAVPVMRWIGDRIAIADRIAREEST